jgi:serine/threonine protein kinase
MNPGAPDGGELQSAQMSSSHSLGSKETRLSTSSFRISFPTTAATKEACAAAWLDEEPDTESLSASGGAEQADLSHQVDFNEIDFEHALEIGSGGSSVVYKTAVYEVPCAVKMLAAELRGWEEKQFGSEVKLLTRVRHPNLCRLYACSTNGPQKCLLLELMECALDSRLIASPLLGYQQRVWIALSVRELRLASLPAAVLPEVFYRNRCFNVFCSPSCPPQICRALAHLHALSPPIIHRCAP